MGSLLKGPAQLLNVHLLNSLSRQHLLTVLVFAQFREPSDPDTKTQGHF